MRQATCRALGDGGWKLAFLALLALPLFWNLRGGELLEWDEGLVLRHVQSAFFNHSWAVPVQRSGLFSKGFSKPPLLLWEVAGLVKLFGWSPAAIRAGTAAALYATALAAYGWGKTMASSVSVGLAWAFLVACSGGALLWGRNVNVEMLLGMFSVLALVAYGYAMRGDNQRGVWLAISALSLVGAFMTKQLACALAAIPILLTEALLFSRQDWRSTVGRLAVVAGVPLAAAGAWVIKAAATDFGRLSHVVDFTIRRRMQGLSSDRHFNFVNKLAGILDEAFSPFAWELGVIGLGLLVWQYGARRNVWVTLVVTYFATSIVVFELATRTLLPWYAWSVALPLYAGLAFVLGRALEYTVCWLTSAVDDGAVTATRELGPPPVEWLAGMISIAMGLSRLWSTLLSRPMLVMAIVSGCVVGWWVLRTHASRTLRAVSAALMVLWPSAALAYGLAKREAYHQDPGALFGLADPVMQSVGLRRTSVDPRVAGDVNRHQALFGAKAFPDKPPWEDNANQFNVAAHVEPLQLPVEYEPPQGTQVWRSAGVVAWTGDLVNNPRPEREFEALASRGPLTFVAAESASDVGTGLGKFAGMTVREADGLDRAMYRPVITELAEVNGPPLPAGNYEVQIWFAAECDRNRTVDLGHFELTLGGASQTLVLSCVHGGRRGVLGLRSEQQTVALQPNVMQALKTTVVVPLAGTVRFKAVYNAGILRFAKLQLTHAEL